jgi:hypothetical protein
MKEHGIFCRLQGVHTDYGTHPASYSMDTTTFSKVLKWPGRGADHSLSTTAEKIRCGAMRVITISPYAFIK